MNTLIQDFFCLLGIPFLMACATLPSQDRTPSGSQITSHTASPVRDKIAARTEALVYDAGTLWNGAFISHAFTIANSGDQPLTIRDVAEGEGVRVARFTREIPPDGSGEVVCEISTRRLSGPVRITAQVQFAAPARPPLELVVTADVRTSVTVAPETRVHFEHDAGKPLSWHFLVTSPRKADFIIRRIETFSPHLTSAYRLASAENTGTRGHVYDLTLTLDPGTPVGIFRDLVKIHTDIPDGYPGEIVFFGAIRGRLMFRPEHLTFGPGPDGACAPARLSISNRSGAPFAVTGVETDTPAIQWQAAPVANGRAQLVDFRYSGPVPTARILRGKLVVLTDVAEMTRIEVGYAVFPVVHCGGK